MNRLAFAVSIICFLYGSAVSRGQDNQPRDIERAELQRDAQRLIDQAYREADLGRFADAEAHYTQALDLFRRLFPMHEHPRGHPSIASCAFDLGNVLLKQGKFAQAEKYYRSALDMWKQLYPEREAPNGHPEIASTLNNLGVALMRQGKLDGAADCHREALAMRRRLFPKDRFPLGHIQIAKSLIELGGVFDLQGSECSHRLKAGASL
jgi:tetratricopeptide (TPR) repeat protein